MKKVITICGILMLVVLTACSSSGDEVPAVAAQVPSGDRAADGGALTTLVEVPSGETATDSEDLAILEDIPSGNTEADGDALTTSGKIQSEGTESSVRLNENYSDALPVQTQLALGTMLLNDSDLAVDGDQAVALLPLWRAVQSLTTSGTAADAEITAVINQIQAGMMTEQIAAIADMQLTQEALRSLVQEGVIAIDVGDVKRGSSDGAAGSGARGGGAPGGGGGALGGQVDPALQATRQAEGGGNNLLNQAVTKAIVQMLQLKTT